MAPGLWPWLQVFRISKMTRGGERYGTLLSDGAHFIAAILPASADHLIADGRIRPGTMFRLRGFTVATLGNSRVIEVKQLEVIQTDREMIGNPNAYTSSHLQHKHDKLDVDSVASPAELNCGDYSCGQGVNWPLTRGVLAVLQRHELQQPVMQVVGVSQMRLNLKNAEYTYHLILSDGVYTVNATLASPTNHLVEHSHLKKGTVVCLRMFKYYTIKSLSMICIGAVDILQTESELIGSPKAYEICCNKNPYGSESNCGEPYSGSVANYAQTNIVSYSSCQNLEWYLTHGSVPAILKGEMSVEERPVMQVVDFSLMSQNGFRFYRLLLSDGVYQMYTSLFPHLSHLVVGNYLCKGTRVRLLKFICDTFGQDNNLIYGSQLILSVLGKECELIGSPIFYELRNKGEYLDADHAASILLDDLVQSMGRSHLAGQGQMCILTKGIVALLQQPVMQVVIVYPMTSEWKWLGMYNLILSDGVHTHDAVLHKTLNHLVMNTNLRVGTIIHPFMVVCYSTQGPSRIIVSELEVLQTECRLIGSPKAYKLCSIQNLDGQSFKEHLTQAAAAAMVEGEITVEQQPVMQVFSFSSWLGYSIELSDGIHKAFACLSPYLMHLVKDSHLRDGTIVRVLKVVLEDRYNFTIEELEVLQIEHEPIGHPVYYVCREARSGQKEWANHAAYVSKGDSAKPTGGSYPRYKATPG